MAVKDNNETVLYEQQTENMYSIAMELPFPDYTYEPLDKLGEIGVLIFGGLITLVLGLGIGYALKKSD